MGVFKQIRQIILEVKIACILVGIAIALCYMYALYIYGDVTVLTTATTRFSPDYVPYNIVLLICVPVQCLLYVYYFMRVVIYVPLIRWMIPSYYDINPPFFYFCMQIFFLLFSMIGYKYYTVICPIMPRFEPFVYIDVREFGLHYIPLISVCVISLYLVTKYLVPLLWNWVIVSGNVYRVFVSFILTILVTTQTCFWMIYAFIYTGRFIWEFFPTYPTYHNTTIGIVAVFIITFTICLAVRPLWLCYKNTFFHFYRMSQFYLQDQRIGVGYQHSLFPQFDSNQDRTAHSVYSMHHLGHHGVVNSQCGLNHRFGIPSFFYHTSLQPRWTIRLCLVALLIGADYFILFLSY